MKKLVLILSLALSINSFAQNWDYQERDSDFDGRYKASYVFGEGEFPYLEPLLAVRKSENNELEIMLTNVAYGSNSLKLTMLIRFDDKVVKLYNASCSVNGDSWFIKVDNETKLKIIEEMKTCSRVRIRLSSRVGNSDYHFNLNGSTSAINKLDL